MRQLSELKFISNKNKYNKEHILSNRIFLKKRRFKFSWIAFILIIIIAAYISIICKYDPFFSKQWSLNDPISGINAEKMWEYEKKHTSERSVTVAVIDTGVDFNNKELKGRMWKAFNKNNVLKQIDSDYDSYHGTMCAEIITANHNGYGMEGIASSVDVKIMSLKALSSQHSIGEGSIDDIINAIKFAENNGAHICNLSFGTDIYSQELYEVMRNSGMLFITSAGNATSFRGINIDKKPYYPASFNLKNMISVTCIDAYGNFSNTANHGKKSVDIAAPGIDIPVVQANGQLGFVSGTSFAVPHVSGVAAVLYAFDENLNASQCKRYICTTVQKKESLCNKCKTAGSIDGYSAFKKLIESRGR